MQSMSKADKVKYLLENYGQNDQRTAAWHAKRGQMLTASEIYKALPDATPAQRHELIMSKLQPRPQVSGPGSRALAWGTRFEPIAKQIYEELNFNHIKILDTTCIPHADVPFLGASPDGIIVTEDTNDFRYGKLVEFKCPISRQFTNETPVPKEYYHQMQLQMECTGLDECEYIEMGFKQVNYTEWMDSKSDYKSFFAILSDESVRYKDMHDPRKPADWREDELKDVDDSVMCYWILNTWRSLTVNKQKDWLSSNLPSFESVWKEVQEHRNSGTLPQAPKEKTTLVL